MDGATIIQIVGEFLENFKKNFNRAPASDKKELIHQVVDKKEAKVYCYFEHFPGTQIGEELKSNGDPFWVNPVWLKRTFGTQQTYTS